MKRGYKESKKKDDMKKAYAMPMVDENPRVSVDSGMLPAVKDWKIGKKYKLVLEVELTGLHEKYGSDEICGDFEIYEASSEKD